MYNKGDLVIGVVGGEWYNKGSEAMLHTVLHKLSGKNVKFNIFIPDVELVKASPFHNRKDVSVSFLNANKVIFIKDTLLSFVGRLFNIKWSKIISKNLSIYDTCDVVIDIHGYALHNKNNFKVHLYLLGKLFQVKMLRKKYYIFPQDIEYLNSIFSRLLCRFILPMADSISVRGLDSFYNVKKMLGGRCCNLAVVPDIAFALPVGYYIDPNFQTWSQERKVDRKLIVLSVNKKVKRAEGKISYEQLLKSVTKVMIDREYSVVLVPHDIRGSQETHDLGLCNRIYSDLPELYKKETFVIDGLDLTPSMYREIIKQCDIGLTSRFHMAVATLSQNIPTATLGYSFKYMQLLNWFNQEEWALDGVNVELDEVVETLDKLDKKASQIKPELVLANKKIKSDLQYFFSRIIKKISG